ncbi:MAG: 50S ribosomal protein L25/general stress protein Ctc [Actinomyces urogenitalis]|uniref:Large ribosomal subunit protein bL25 n=3 Tax=root TaxID=1 RepID=C0W7W7_9ACTO|nr:50S ribosomal protein L25/general stress protein Ctc [Actinomyces urogenitalis]EEH65166.1 ribosomal protein L25, Ctc-form [Actinomyces urogenitalis DSM 15434]KGF02481.1 50S ribosomal protein L25 [Actinomyces urogenitalis S6-C4]MBS5977961.1 50S ribosomal protein L25/general stress protein Ctc [Actinomyces urogenitalis]MBS6072900.1 50S ribosomal protein L25/general stress protein Ctc [Actinomyces urogenitalis]MDK8238219.1 50S ribosomal protein L25/general stress protein Ctc [Actinomyces uroge
MANKAITLKGTDRTNFGKGSARQARRNGQVPVVVYGHGTEPRHFLLEEHATRLALRGNENALVELAVDGETILVLTKDVQRHPIRPGVQHVDFQLVNRNERVEVEVPVTVIGEPVASTIHMVEAAHLLVSAPVISIPEAIEIDITGVEAGTTIRVSDITLPEGVEAVTDAEEDVVNVVDEASIAVDVPEPEAGAEAADEAEAPAEAE